MKILSHIKKIAIIFLSIFIIIFALSAPYSTLNVDKLAYVIALGLDLGDSNNLKLTVELAKPQSSSGGSSGADYEKIINTVECSSIDSGISLLNNYVSRRINLSHCEALVISEELASQGVSDYIYTLLSSVNMSPHASVIISKIPAAEFLDISQPELEDLPSKYYETSLTSNEYTGYTQNVTLINFFSDCVDSFTNPVATLGSSATLSTDSKDNIENIGLAVFKNDALVGELSAEETICHMIVSSKLDSCTVSIPNPIGDSENIDLKVMLANDTKNDVSLVNGSPYVSSKININIQIISSTEASTSGDANYYKATNSELIEEACNEYFKENVNNYLYKTAKEFNSDIDSFGKYAVKYFYTIQEWEKYNWLDSFKDSTFNVEVQSNLKSGYTFL